MSEEDREQLSRRDFARLAASGLGAFAASDVLIRLFRVGGIEVEACCIACELPCDANCEDPCEVCEMCDETCEAECGEDVCGDDGCGDDGCIDCPCDVD